MFEVCSSCIFQYWLSMLSQQWLYAWIALLFLSHCFWLLMLFVSYCFEVVVAIVVEAMTWTQRLRMVSKFILSHERGEPSYSFVRGWDICWDVQVQSSAANFHGSILRRCRESSLAFLSPNRWCANACASQKIVAVPFLCAVPAPVPAWVPECVSAWVHEYVSVSVRKRESVRVWERANVTAGVCVFASARVRGRASVRVCERASVCVCVGVCMCMCGCVCVCVCAWRRDRWVFVLCVCVCVCVWGCEYVKFVSVRACHKQVRHVHQKHFGKFESHITMHTDNVVDVTSLLDTCGYFCMGGRQHYQLTSTSQANLFWISSAPNLVQQRNVSNSGSVTAHQCTSWLFMACCLEILKHKGWRTFQNCEYFKLTAIKRMKQIDWTRDIFCPKLYIRSYYVIILEKRLTHLSNYRYCLIKQMRALSLYVTISWNNQGLTIGDEWVPNVPS